MSYNKLPAISIPSLNLESIPSPPFSKTSPYPPLSSSSRPTPPHRNTHYDFYVDVDSDPENEPDNKIPLPHISITQHARAPPPHSTHSSIENESTRFTGRMPAGTEPDESTLTTCLTQSNSHDLAHPPINVAIQTINDLYSRYQTEPYMFQKTHNYICFQLPAILENIRKTHLERQMRVEKMTHEQDNFIYNFLSTNHYFYSATSEIFFKYDGLNYQITPEDEILYHILTTISKEKQLMSWKQRTKVYILKRIKEISIMKSIPESETIQKIYETLIPSIFSSKSEAKYFLCVLGDIILKKTNNELMFFISTEAKHFIRELSNLSIFLFGVNLLTHLKVKYYQHTYAYSRLVPISKQIKESPWLPQLALNMLVVACHYSTRYETSDNYLDSFCNDRKLIDYVYFLKMRTPETIVNREFIVNYLKKCDPEQNQHLSWKNMQYLWKQYLDSENLPNIMFQQTLKNIICDVPFMEYNGETDIFQNITSHYLPAIQHFLSFWKETMTVQSDTTNEYEIEELCILYRKWCSIKKASYHHSTITEKRMIDYIRFYCPTIEIEQNKYVCNIRCSLWDKQMDIQTAMHEYLTFNADSPSLLCRSAGDQHMVGEQTDDAVMVPFNHLAQESTIPVKGSTRFTGQVPAGTRPDELTLTVPKEVSIYDAYLWYCKIYGAQGSLYEIDSGAEEEETGACEPYMQPAAFKKKQLLVSKSYFEKYIMEAFPLAFDGDGEGRITIQNSCS